VPLGLLEGTAYDETRFSAQPGDLLVFYSDGIQDQQNFAEDDYGSTRLGDLLRKVCNQSVQSIAKAILKDVDKFRGAARVTDDQTLVVLRVKPEVGAAVKETGR
jgi:sigma-B regulation protein RsbU (phosphoserine phosphatase)